MNKRIKLFVVGMCLFFATLKLEAAPTSLLVTDVGLDGSNNVTSINVTTLPIVITPANLIGSTTDLSNINRVFNGTGVAPASVAEAQPYAGDLSLLTGFQDLTTPNYLNITFNTPINTVDGNIDFVLMHARLQPPGISFQAVDTLGVDIPGALVSASPQIRINKGVNPANHFWTLPTMAVVGNFPQDIVYTHAVGFGYTGTIGGVKVILGSPTGTPVVPGATIEVFEALGVTGVTAPLDDTNFDDMNNTDIADFHILRSNFLTGTTHAEGDANFDSLVNHRDFFLWRTAFLSGGGSAADIDWSPVPEPAAGMLVLTCTMASVLVRRTPRRIRKCSL